MADIGWITGHSYVVYGPLANGATTVLFESVPTYPNPGKIRHPNYVWLIMTYSALYFLSGRYWEMVERLRINQLYTAPTALRLLLKSGELPLPHASLSCRMPSSPASASVSSPVFSPSVLRVAPD